MMIIAVHEGDEFDRGFKDTIDNSVRTFMEQPYVLELSRGNWAIHLWRKLQDIWMLPNNKSGSPNDCMVNELLKYGAAPYCYYAYKTF